LKWAALGLSIILDIAIAAGLTYLDERDSKPFMFLMALLFLWVVPAAVSAWGFVKFWIAYHLFLKRMLVRGYKAKFHEFKFPPSGAFFDHMQYFSHIMDSEQASQDMKLKAAFLLGEISTYKTDKPMTLGFAATIALQVAMEEYRPAH